MATSCGPQPKAKKKQKHIKASLALDRHTISSFALISIHQTVYAFISSQAIEHAVAQKQRRIHIDNQHSQFMYYID